MQKVLPPGAIDPNVFFGFSDVQVGKLEEGLATVALLRSKKLIAGTIIMRQGIEYCKICEKNSGCDMGYAAAGIAYSESSLFIGYSALIEIEGSLGCANISAIYPLDNWAENRSENEEEIKQKFTFLQDEQVQAGLKLADIVAEECKIIKGLALSRGNTLRNA